MATRARLQGLFGDECDEDGKLKAKGDKHRVAPRELRRGKQEIYADLKRSLQGLKAKWNGPSEYDSWFDMPINKAHLNSVAAYFDLVPGFEQLLALNGGDFGILRRRGTAGKAAKTRTPRTAADARAFRGGAALWYFLFLTFLSGSVALWTFLVAIRAEPGRGILLYSGLAGLASVAGNMFTLQALGRLPEPVVFPVSLAGPVIGAVLLGTLFFREKTRPLGHVGILLGLGGIVLLALS